MLDQPAERSADRVALVTGGGSGIGAATAAVLQSSGWQVVICGRRQSALDAVAATTGAATIAADVSTPDDARRLVQVTVERFGRLDGLVLNAGVVRPGSVGELSDEDWDAMVATNLSGPFRIRREALPHLVDSGGGVVGVASMSALRATSRYRRLQRHQGRPGDADAVRSQSTTDPLAFAATCSAQGGPGPRWRTARWPSCIRARDRR